ncbi:response regulator transcription factor [Streptomyces sp. NBC_01549]|uniref:response regulator transcription factor n=1 Tax=Streptomyces sp. NBC_01549 TaxID=2975874 RepID=UPI002B1CD4D9|nr:response regulator transcription factor [Streptomyces sp. NBC_01549]
MRVLVVESDDQAADSLVGRLGRTGHRARRVHSGRAALRSWEEADLVLLDLGLPDLDGLEVCREIRAKSNTPVITFTSGGTELDRVLSLQAGADDCLVKPYGYRELVARMEAVMRRAMSWSTTSAISRGSLYIDPCSRQVRVGERVVEVTRKEFDLLYLLASLPETAMSRKDLMAKVWADEWASSSRTIDTHVSALRGKLGDSDWIITVRGVGYRLGGGPES